MLHNLLNTLSEDLSSSLKDSLSGADFIPGTVCFFMFNHHNKKIFCHLNDEFQDHPNINIKRKLSLLNFLKNIYQEDFSTFLTQQKKISRNLEGWINKGTQDFKIVQDVRFKLNDDQNMRLLIQQKILSFKFKRAEWSVGSCTDISHIKEGNELSLAVFSDGERLALEKVLGWNDKELFTERELEVLRLLSIGYKSKDIEKILNISLHTVRTHRRNMLKKTRLKSTMELVNFASKEGILKPSF